MSRAPSRAGLVAWLTLLLAVLAFGAYCVDLMLTVSHERAEVAVRVGWLRRAQDLAQRPDAGAQAALRLAVEGHPGGAPLADHLAAKPGNVDGFVRAVRGELSELSTSLGARWDALNLIALAALGFAGLSLGLLVVLGRRQRAAEAARERLAATNDELRRANAAARQASEEKSRLVAYVSHEFRTPLQAIMGMAALLEDRALTDDQRKRHMAILRGASDDLLRLIDGLLDAAKLESGKSTIRIDEFSPRTLLEQVLGLLEPSAAKKGLALRSELAPDLPKTLSGDRMRLRQVVINLVGNAIKFTSRGHVTLRARARVDESHARLRVEVTDTGPGMTQATRAKLFQPFARANDSGVVRTEGSGLGLAISKQLIEALGGRLDVESTPGIGSTFWFEVDMPVSELASPPAQAPAAGSTVLVADDDASSRALLQAVITRAGHGAEAVADGEAAVAAALARTFVAAVLDVQLPGLDGPSAARRIRAARPGLPLVALTGHTEIEVHDRCRSAGFDAVLVKPVGLDMLRATLARVMSEKSGPLDLSVLRSYQTPEDPDFVPGLIDVYVQESERDLSALQAAATRGDMKTVTQLAHRLKGSSAGFGARALAEQFQALYAAARAGAATDELLASVAQELGRVRAALLAEKSRLAGRPK